MMMNFREKKKRGRGGNMNSFKIKDTNQNHKTNTSKPTDFNFIEKELLTNYLEIDKVRNIPVNLIPDKDKKLIVMTTSNINSAEILSVIDNKFKIIDVYFSAAVINEVGRKLITEYNLKGLLCRDKSDGSFISQKVIDKIECDIKKKSNAHLKNFIIECKDNNYITVISSANPSISSKNEIYTIYNSFEKYQQLLKIFNHV